MLLELHHSLFFIKMRYWPVIMMAAADILVLVLLVREMALIAG